MSETKDPQARVYEKDGVLILDDPQAVAVARAVARHNCKLLFGLNLERARHFVSRMKERGDSPKDILITIISVDDPCGGMLADVLMPGHDWQSYRDRGEKPVARGLASREGIEEALAVVDTEAAEKLRSTEGIAIVVIEDGVAEIFTPADL